MAIQLGDLPTWLASAGTVGTLVAALFQIRSERNRRLEQEARDRAEARRQQAFRIACWPGAADPAGPLNPWWGSSTAFHLVNGSAEPVYNLVVALVHIQGAGIRRAEEWKGWLEERGHPAPRSTVTLLPPGQWRVWVPGTEWQGGLGMRLSAEVAFTDRAGVSWIRRGNGALEELPKPTLDYFADYAASTPFIVTSRYRRQTLRIMQRNVHRSSLHAKTRIDQMPLGPLRGSWAAALPLRRARGPAGGRTPRLRGGMDTAGSGRRRGRLDRTIEDR
jgi:hypothetical protein